MDFRWSLIHWNDTGLVAEPNLLCDVLFLNDILKCHLTTILCFLAIYTCKRIKIALPIREDC